MTEQTKDIMLGKTGWKLKLGAYGDWEPMQHREVEETINRKKTGNKIWKWCNTAHYFPNPQQAIRWIVRQDMMDDTSQCEMQDYIDQWDELMTKYFGEIKNWRL
jgi:hypothetical protein